MSSQFLELSLKQLLTDMMRLKEVIVNQRLHDGRTAAAVPPERGVTVAVASRECMRGPQRVSQEQLCYRDGLCTTRVSCCSLDDS